MAYREESSEVVQNFAFTQESKLTFMSDSQLPKSSSFASDLRSADCLKQNQPPHTKEYPLSQSKGPNFSDSIETLEKQIIHLKSENETLNKVIAQWKSDYSKLEMEFERFKADNKSFRKSYRYLKGYAENLNDSTTERKLNQSSPMDEAQKEHPLITATSVGHPEVKQEIEAFFRKVRHELPAPVHTCSKTEMWQNITKTFQAIFNITQEKMLDHLHQKLCEEFKEQKVSSDTMKAFSYLLNATSKKEASDDFIRDVHEEVLKLPLIVNEQQELKDLSKEMTCIAWKMMALNPPLLPSQPVRYKEEMHEPFPKNWNVASGPFDLIYYLPVIIYANSGHVACKGLVGNKPSESPDCPNFAELSDSDNDSEDEVFKEPCKAPDTSTTNKPSDLNAASRSTCCF